METVLFTIFIVGYILYQLERKTRRKRYRRKKFTAYKAPLPKQQSYELRSIQEASINTELSGSAYVVDGDTIVIQKTQIRLFGIDAPEMNHPFGKDAKWAMISLCKGRNIRAVIVSQDTHGRTVAKCYLPDGSDLSAELVKLGLAIDWPKHSGGQYRDLEVPGVRVKLWLADARQKGHMHIWEKYDADNNSNPTSQ
ncbi:thermonuclease family protein [Pseudotabrizicola formosa]|uniref:thermonuclease family protein n=1 Tax=Pseudotabrizicola formosa TaxID=2030009 RepID=UPI000CD14992|nr:thermonuclease family protein [Pseudotabrizicola formosa]